MTPQASLRDYQELLANAALQDLRNNMHNAVIGLRNRLEDVPPSDIGQIATLQGFIKGYRSVEGWLERSLKEAEKREKRNG